MLQVVQAKLACNAENYDQHPSQTWRQNQGICKTVACTCPASKCSWVNERFLNFCGSGWHQPFVVCSEVAAASFVSLSKPEEAIICFSFPGLQGLQTPNMKIAVRGLKQQLLACAVTCACDCMCAKLAR